MRFIGAREIQNTETCICPTRVYFGARKGTGQQQKAQKHVSQSTFSTYTHRAHMRTYAYRSRWACYVYMRAYGFDLCGRWFRRRRRRRRRPRRRRQQLYANASNKHTYGGSFTLDLERGCAACLLIDLFCFKCNDTTRDLRSCAHGFVHVHVYKCELHCGYYF